MTAMPQHLQALAAADAKRLAAAAFRQELRGLGRKRSAEAARRLAEALADPDDAVGVCKISLLLKAVPGMGDSSAHKCLVASSVPNGERRVRDLTVRQRNLISAQLFFWAATRR